MYSGLIKLGDHDFLKILNTEMLNSESGPGNKVCLQACQVFVSTPSRLGKHLDWKPTFILCQLATYYNDSETASFKNVAVTFYCNLNHGFEIMGYKNNPYIHVRKNASHTQSITFICLYSSRTYYVPGSSIMEMGKIQLKIPKGAHLLATNSYTRMC